MKLLTAALILTIAVAVAALGCAQGDLERAEVCENIDQLWDDEPWGTQWYLELEDQEFFDFVDRPVGEERRFTIADVMDVARDSALIDLEDAFGCLEG